MVSSTYTEKELRKEAVMAIQRDAKHAKLKARTLGYSIRITDSRVQLIAHGQTLEGFEFDVSIMT